MSMDFFDILFAKKYAPLPENGYLKTEVVSYPATAEQLPIPKCDVAITDQKQCQVIVSDVPVFDDDAPYLFRESAGGNNVLEKKLTGVTIANTQHARNGNFASSSNWSSSSLRSAFSIADNVATIYNIVDNDAYFNQTGIPFLLNHKYLIKIDAKCTNAMNLNTAVFTANFTSVASFSRILTTDYTTVASIINCSNANASQVAFTLNGAFDENTIANFRNAQIIDLTQMLGTAIADYVYTLEQSTAGSGIAWLKSYGFLTKDYYDYNAGSLQSVKVSGKKVVGFNQWDEEWEVGTFNIQGQKESGNANIRSKNYISVLQNTEYYHKCPTGVWLYYYNKNKDYISRFNDGIGNNAFTTPSDCYYMMISPFVAYGTTYNNDICINISCAAKNGTYEPYTSITYPLGNDELLGVPKLVNNQLTYDGDIKTADGAITRRYGVVDLGSLTWTKVTNTNGSMFYTLGNIISGKTVTVNDYDNAISNKLVVAPTSKVNNIGVSGVSYSPDNRIRVSDRTGGSYASLDATTFKNAMSGVYLVYELATPTTESSSSFAEIQTVYDGGTEEFVDTRDVPVPVGHESTYYNGQAYITDFDNPTTGIIHMAELHSIVPPSGEFYIESNGTVDVDVWKK